MKLTLPISLFILLSLTFGSLLQADQIIMHRADSHAPIAVMNDHHHKKQEFMTSYRFMSMDMKGNIQGNNDIATTDIAKDGAYMMAPEKMSMQMNMIGGMFGLRDTTTLMVMTSYQINEMTSIKKSGEQQNMETSGFSDLTISTIQSLVKKPNQAWIANAGIRLPLGSIDESNNGNRLPYAMQLGSGTYDLVLGSTYTKFLETLSIGSQVSSIIRTGKNTHGYRLGNTVSITTWIAKSVQNNWSISTRLSSYLKTNISGSDSTLDSMMSPTTSTNTERKSIFISIGSNYKFTKSILKGSRLAVELAVPLYQAAGSNSIQMKSQSSITMGYQKTFK
tara:strand:+ start:1908 stop:2912 length:1005 start_codon:yes stop_codon:yes gene_type:complete